MPRRRVDPATPARPKAPAAGCREDLDRKAFNNLYHVYFEFVGDRMSKTREYNDTAHVWETLRAGQRSAEGPAAVAASATRSP